MRINVALRSSVVFLNAWALFLAYFKFTYVGFSKLGLWKKWPSAFCLIFFIFASKSAYAEFVTWTIPSTTLSGGSGSIVVGGQFDLDESTGAFRNINVTYNGANITTGNYTSNYVQFNDGGVGAPTIFFDFRTRPSMYILGGACGSMDPYGSCTIYNASISPYEVPFTQTVNAAPTVAGVPASISVVEDTASNVDLSSAIFADADGDNLTVWLSTSAGALTAVSGGGVTIGGSGTSTLTLSGSAGNINTFLDTVSNIQYTTAANASGNNVATLTISASDGTVGLASNPTVQINAQGLPDVTGVSAGTTNAHYREGVTISVQVTFDEVITVTGTPTLSLETGTVDRTVTYTSGSGSSALTFDYTVQAGDTSADLDYVSINALALAGGTIQGALGAADLTLPAPGAANSLGANNAIVIDTTVPVVTDGGISLAGASGTGGIFKVGDTVTASWDTSGSDGDTNITASLGSVTVDFSAFGGANNVAATLSGTTWTASYTIVANTSTSGSNLNVAVTATDEAGNFATGADTSNATVDANPPVVSAANVTLSGATGTSGAFKIGDTAMATWDNTASGDNNGDIASVSVDFTEFGGGAAVAATNNSGTWTATYTITSGSIDLTNRNVSVTAIDTTGNSSSQAGANNVIVDNIDPTVVDGDITVSGGTGPSSAFKVGDTVTVAWTANNTDTVDTVEVDFSAFGGPAATTATESSGVWTATYVLTAGSLSSSSLQISVTAYDDAGNDLSTTKATVYTANTVVPTVAVTGPTEIVTEQFIVNIEFSEAVSSDLIASEIRVENGSVASVSAVSGSSTQFTAAIDPVLGNTVLVQVVAGAVTNTAGGNPNTASNEFTVFAGNVATAFEEYREEIRQVILDEAERSLRSGLSANQRMVREARDRFVAAQREQAECSQDDTGSSNEETCEVGLVSRNNVAFDVDGSFALRDETLSTSGTFFQQTGNYEGTQRRLFFGDFDVQHDGDTGSTTATLTGRMAWEQMVSDGTMLGFFVGGELTHSNIDGAFEGDQDRIGVTIGGYAVHQLADQVYLDGFLSYGIGRNNLDMTNDVLALTSDYTTRTATAGAALSGVYEYERYEFRPELAFSYGHTWIGNVGFTGRAYGLVDDTLSLDAGNVSIANLTLRPEVVWALDADTVSESRSQLSFAPRAICERTIATTRTENCGGGAELGLSSTSEDGLSNAEIRFVRDRIGSSYRSSFALNIEHRF